MAWRVSGTIAKRNGLSASSADGGSLDRNAGIEPIVIDERDPGQLAAREHAVDPRVVGRLDELVGARRRCGDGEREERHADQLEAGVGHARRAEREAAETGAGKGRGQR